MNEFEKFHPFVNFMYFFAVLGFSMVFMHPAALVISLISGFSYSVILKGRKNLLYVLPLVLLTALINPLLNHRGMTVITFLPNGNPITYEGVLYGTASAVMLWSVLCHFFCFNKIMTSDKIIYLFGKILPSLSLILSMILRFIPRFRAQFQSVYRAQSFLETDPSTKKLIHKIKRGIKTFSAMVTWSLEGSVDTADSMRCRGYGLPNRSAYSNFRIEKRDVGAIFYITALSAYIIYNGVRKTLYFKYFPVIKGGNFNICVFIAYFMLFMFPIIIEIREVIRWKKLKSKI